MLSACQQSLSKLQLDYLDLYLIHSSVRFRKGVCFPTKKEDVSLGYDAEATSKCWEVREFISLSYDRVCLQDMEELVRKGLYRAIGISNSAPPRQKHC